MKKYRINGSQVQRFCNEMKDRGIADSDREICDLLGIVPTTMIRYKKDGASKQVALSFRAVLDKSLPYGIEKFDTD